MGEAAVVSFAAQVVVPAAAVLLLFSLGLTLDRSELVRLVKRPRGLAIGLLARWVVVPGVAVLLCLLDHPAPSTALGLLLVASCPLATPAPALVRAAAGDTSLAVALTAATNLASAITLPLLLSVGAALLGIQGRVEASALGGMALRVGALVIVPTVLGMGLRRARPGLAAWVEPRVTPFAAALLLPIVGLVLFSARESLGPSLAESGGLALGLNLVSLGVTVLLARGARLSRGETAAVLLGAGLFNFGLDVFVSLTLLGDVRILLPGIAYGALMWASAAGIVGWGRRSRPLYPVQSDAEPGRQARIG